MSDTSTLLSSSGESAGTGQSAKPDVRPELHAGDLVPGAASYQIDRKLGAGTFGEVYEAVDRLTGARVAVKLESVHAVAPQLHYEKRILDELQHVPGIPRLVTFRSTPEVHVLAMQLLLTDVEAVRAKVRRLPVPLVTKIGYQTLQRLDALHSRGLAHRDIKPNNIMLGYDVARQRVIVYLIDFGLAKRVQHNGRHIELRDGKTLAGTPRYASIRAHMGFEQSRRDDLESLMYVLVYLAKGSLPWQGMETRTTVHYTSFKNKKRDIRSADLCAGLPDVFTQTLQTAKRLRFDECPDYGKLLEEWGAQVAALGNPSFADYV